MGVRYEWVDKSKIVMTIYVEFPWTWKDYNTAIGEVMPLLRDLGYPCATIVDTTKMQAMPRDGNIIQILLDVEKSMPSNLFASVIVGRSHMIRVFMNVLMKMRPRAQRMALFTETVEEAHIKIKERYEEHYPDMAMLNFNDEL